MDHYGSLKDRMITSHSRHWEKQTEKASHRLSLGIGRVMIRNEMSDLGSGQRMEEFIDYSKEF